MGAPVLVDFSETENPNLNDPLLIAEVETADDALPISIRRSLPDGRYQDIPFSWLVKDKGVRDLIKKEKKRRRLVNVCPMMST